ncbi:hypothetical protein ACHAXH_007041 [Discostella pseudostelligera]
MHNHSHQMMRSVERQQQHQQQQQQQQNHQAAAASKAASRSPGAQEFEIEEALFASAPVGVHCVDSNGVILWANRAELNFLGFNTSSNDGGYVGRCVTSFVYSENKVDGDDAMGHQSDTNVMTVDDRTLYNEVLRRVTAGNPISGIPVRFVTRSGTIVYLLLDCDGRAILRRIFDSSSSASTIPSLSSHYFRFFTRDDTARRIQEMRSNVLFQETNRSLQMLDDFMNRSMQQMRAPLTLMERACDLVAENIEDMDEVVRGITIGSINDTRTDPSDSSSTGEHQGQVEAGKSHHEPSLPPTAGGGNNNNRNSTSKNFAIPLAVALSATSEARSVVTLATTLTKDALALVDDITDLCRFDQGRVLLIEKEAVKVQDICLEAMNNITSRTGPIAGGLVDVVLDVQEGTPSRVVTDKGVLRRSLALLLNFAVDAAANAAAASGGGTTTRGKVILSVQDAAGWGGTGDVSACKISVFYSNPMEASIALGSAVVAARKASPMVFFESNNQQHPFPTSNHVNGLNSGGGGNITQKSSFSNLPTPFGEYYNTPTNEDAVEFIQKYHTTVHRGPMAHRIRLRESIQSGMTSCRQEKLGLGLSLLYHLVGAQGSDLRYDLVTEQQGPTTFGLSSMTKFWFLLPMSLDFPDRLPARQVVKDDIQGVSPPVGGGGQSIARSLPNRSPFMATSSGTPDDDMGMQQSRQKIPKLSHPHAPMDPFSQNMSNNPMGMNVPTSLLNQPETTPTSVYLASASTTSNIEANTAAVGGATSTTKLYPGVVPGARPLVLVVEDTDVSASLLCMHLRKLNCTSHRAENGEVAIEMLRSAPAPNMYSLILMDLRMPVMDGFEATKIIKSSNANNIPVVALTGETSEENRKRCDEIGFDAYQTKPLKRPELKELLKKYVPGYTPVD